MIEVDGKKVRRYHVAKDMPRQDNSGWILELKDQKYSVDVDILVNKTAEIKNSHLLMTYAELDSRFQAITYTLKAWNRVLSGDPWNKLNNFTLSLMLIAYMQSQGYMPNLQALSKRELELTRSQIIPKNGAATRLHDVLNTSFEEYERLLAKFDEAGLLRE